MKPRSAIWKRQIFFRAALLAGALTLAGCASISEQTRVYLGSPRYPPTQPASVRVLQTEPPQPKERLGEIFLSVEGNPSQDRLERKLQAAAAKMGADAVFVVSDKIHIIPIVYAGWYWSPVVTEDWQRHIVATAIKYK